MKSGNTGRCVLCSPSLAKPKEEEEEEEEEGASIPRTVMLPSNMPPNNDDIDPGGEPEDEERGDMDMGLSWR